MWQKIMVLGALSLGLIACHTDNDSLPIENNASLCEMLKEKISAENYQNTDPATMKRKNPVDQAKLLKEYDSYSCPEIVDSAPPPNADTNTK